ncbi:protein of unknown function (plasmid) [Shinella sp. WSC3-e]|nr:hypothetical protein SHINE37_100350 [Rhizobiaceae bacterium]CAK7261900.1 protein of unknown function [Shinella sp. WSC3-e]
MLLRLAGGVGCGSRRKRRLGDTCQAATFALLASKKPCRLTKHMQTQQRATVALRRVSI